MSKPLVVNLYGGPGTGKSVMASGLFYRLKAELHINAEITGEYAKKLVWSGRQRTLEDQLYVFGKQHNRVYRLAQDCDVIVSDSPILMGSIYSAHYPRCFHDTVAWAHSNFRNLNFFIDRVGPYNPKGRNQTKEEAEEIDTKIIELLERNDQSYHRHRADQLEEVFEIVKDNI
jgi:hypothetical protein